MEDNEEEKVMLNFNEEDFIITVSPTIDKNLRWTGEVKVGIDMAEQDFLHEEDYYNLLEFCNLICASVPLMEKDTNFRNHIYNFYKKDLQERKRVLTKEGNVIKLNFNSKTDGSA